MKPFKNKLIPLFAAFATLPAQAALAGQNPAYADYTHMGYGGWFFGPLMMILVFTAIIGAIVLVLRLFGIGGTDQTPRNALNLLNERFARGDIDKADYEERRSALVS